MSPDLGGLATEQVVLVDEADEPVGVAEKLAAHRSPGQLHRALSVFLVDERGRLLLQRRAETKHSFAGLWSNSCCTHPRPDEPVDGAARRRVGEELGLSCEVQEVGVFTYRAADPASGLVEHEIDHVLLGPLTGAAHPDPSEVAEVAAIEVAELSARLRAEPERYTPWLAPALAVVLAARPDLSIDPSPNTREDLLP